MLGKDSEKPWSKVPKVPKRINPFRFLYLDRRRFGRALVKSAISNVFTNLRLGHKHGANRRAWFGNTQQFRTKRVLVRESRRDAPGTGLHTLPSSARQLRTQFSSAHARKGRLEPRDSFSPVQPSSADPKFSVLPTGSISLRSRSKSCRTRVVPASCAEQQFPPVGADTTTGL